MIYSFFDIIIKNSIEVLIMAVSYKKLWHLLLDRDLKKKDLKEKANLTSYVMNKLSRDETVTTNTLGKICEALNCKVEDIIDFIPEEQLYGKND